MRQDDLTPHHHWDDVEARLRAALHARAHQASPDYRLDTILSQAGAAGGSTRSSSTRWAAGLLAAACVVALALLLPGLLGGPSEPSPMVPAASPTATEPTAPTQTATPTETPTVDETPIAGIPTAATPTDEATEEPPSADPQLAALPVYLVAHIGDDLRMMRLHREWVNVPDVPRDAPVQARSRAAVAVALAASPPGTDGYIYTWDGVTVEDVQVTAQRITITLSGPGPSNTDDETARISVQQLVWTAQGAVGQGPIPVRIVVADGSDQLFGRLPTSRDYNRPPSTDLYYEDLAPIWINRPTRGEVVDGSDVVVSGEATTFEGAFQWELISSADGSVLESGFGQASAGGPARGTYEIGLGDLDPGEYAIRVFELSMEDGTTVSAERTIPFTVR